MPEETPLMRDWKALRSQLSDKYILLVRLGDFYECFFEDAQKAAPVLNVALTKRNGVPMAGFPHHSALTIYIPKLVKAGMSVAVADFPEGYVPLVEEMKRANAPDGEKPKRVVLEKIKAPRIIRDR